MSENTPSERITGGGLMFAHCSTKMWFLGIAVAVLAANLACSTTRSVRLAIPVVDPPTPQRLIAVSDIHVDAPLKGTNVFAFDDIGHMGNIPGQTCAGEGCNAGFHRATFKYLLKDDSAPLFKQAIQKAGFTIDSSSPLKASATARFNYLLADRGFAHNDLAIHVELALSITDTARSIVNETYIWNEVEKYNSGWVTFPREGTLNSLFNKALSSIVSRMSGDERLRSSIKTAVR